MGRIGSEGARWHDFVLENILLKHVSDWALDVATQSRRGVALSRSLGRRIMRLTWRVSPGVLHGLPAKGDRPE